MIDLGKLRRILAVYCIFYIENQRIFRCEACFEKWTDITVEEARKHFLRHRKGHA